MSPEVCCVLLTFRSVSGLMPFSIFFYLAPSALGFYAFFLFQSIRGRFMKKVAKHEVIETRRQTAVCMLCMFYSRKRCFLTNKHRLRQLSYVMVHDLNFALTERQVLLLR